MSSSKRDQLTSAELARKFYDVLDGQEFDLKLMTNLEKITKSMKVMAEARVNYEQKQTDKMKRLQAEEALRLKQLEEDKKAGKVYDSDSIAEESEASTPVSEESLLEYNYLIYALASKIQNPITLENNIINRNLAAYMMDALKERLAKTYPSKIASYEELLKQVASADKKLDHMQAVSVFNAFSKNNGNMFEEIVESMKLFNPHVERMNGNQNANDSEEDISYAESPIHEINNSGEVGDQGNGKDESAEDELERYLDEGRIEEGMEFLYDLENKMKTLNIPLTDLEFICNELQQRRSIFSSVTQSYEAKESYYTALLESHLSPDDEDYEDYQRLKAEQDNPETTLLAVAEAELHKSRENFIGKMAKIMERDSFKVLISYLTSGMNHLDTKLESDTEVEVASESKSKSNVSTESENESVNTRDQAATRAAAFEAALSAVAKETVDDAIHDALKELSQLTTASDISKTIKLAKENNNAKRQAAALHAAAEAEAIQTALNELTPLSTSSNNSDYREVSPFDKYLKEATMAVRGFTLDGYMDISNEPSHYSSNRAGSLKDELESEEVVSTSSIVLHERDPSERIPAIVTAMTSFTAPLREKHKAAHEKFNKEAMAILEQGVYTDADENSLKNHFLEFLKSTLPLFSSNLESKDVRAKKILNEVMVGSVDSPLLISIINTAVKLASNFGGIYHAAYSEEEAKKREGSLIAAIEKVDKYGQNFEKTGKDIQKIFERTGLEISVNINAKDNSYEVSPKNASEAVRLVAIRAAMNYLLHLKGFSNSQEKAVVATQEQVKGAIKGLLAVDLKSSAGSDAVIKIVDTIKNVSRDLEASLGVKSAPQNTFRFSLFGQKEKQSKEATSQTASNQRPKSPGG